MTVTDIRPDMTAHPETTVESAELADIDAQITAVTAKLKDPQGWADRLEEERDRLLGLREQLLAAAVDLTATTVLAA